MGSAAHTASYALGMSEMADFQPRPPGVRATAPPGDLSVRLASVEDAGDIAAISAEREGLNAVAIQLRVEAELALPLFGEYLAVWVAKSKGTVLGFGRARFDDQAEGTGPRAVPTGWYLMGVVVRPDWRRRGIARALLAARLSWVAERTDRAYSVTSEYNRASQALLHSVGFRTVQRDVTHPRITFNKGVGLLLAADLSDGDREPS